MQDASIIARLGLDTAGFRKGLTDAKSSIKDVGSQLAGLAGISLSVGGVATLAQQILAFAGNLQDAADAIGVDVVALQELTAAFAQSGAGSEVVSRGLTNLAQSSVAAREGNKDLANSFTKLGVSTDELRELSLDEILMRIAASSGSAIAPADRLSALLDVLGKSGGKMAAGLNAGAEAIRNLRREAATLSKEEIGQLDAAGDLFERTWNRIKVAGAKAMTFKPGSFAKDIQALQEKAALPGNPKAEEEAEAAKTQAAKDARARQEQEKNRATSQQIERQRIADETAANAKAQSNALLGDQRNADKLADQDEKHDEERKERAKKIAELEQQYADALLESRRKGKEALGEIGQANAANAAATLENARQDFIADKMAGPDATLAKKRADRKAENLGERFDRVEDLKKRGGMAPADFNKEDMDQALLRKDSPERERHKKMLERPDPHGGGRAKEDNPIVTKLEEIKKVLDDRLGKNL